MEWSYGYDVNMFIKYIKIVNSQVHITGSDLRGFRAPMEHPGLPKGSRRTTPCEFRPEESFKLFVREFLSLSSMYI